MTYLDIDKRKKRNVSRQRQAAEVGGAGVVGAGVGTEAHQAFKTSRQTKKGYRVTEATKPTAPHAFRRIPGISDAPVGAPISQHTHPEGVYHISTASLARHRSKPSLVPSSNQRKLKDIISEQGMTKPIHMKIYKDGPHIWDGQHRLAIADELGHKSVPVSVKHVSRNRPKPKAVSGLINQGVQRRYQARMVASFAKSRSIMTIDQDPFELAKSRFFKHGKDCPCKACRAKYGMHKSAATKFATKYPMTTGAAIGLPIGLGINEGTRRARNKRSGLKISPKDQYIHQYKSNARWTNASMARRGKTTD